MQYFEKIDGSISFDDRNIPVNLDDEEYNTIIASIASGESELVRWSGGELEAQYLARQWKSSRAVAVAAITVTVDSMVFDGDEISQGRMARAVVASDSDAEETVWVLADNTAVTVTSLQLKQALKLAGTAQTAVWVRA